LTLHCHAQHSGARRLKKQVVDKLHQKTLNEVIVCNAFDKEQNKFVSPRWLPPMHDCATGQKMGRQAWWCHELNTSGSMWIFNKGWSARRVISSLKNLYHPMPIMLQLQAIRPMLT
jgi:hypothetical protein